MLCSLWSGKNKREVQGITLTRTSLLFFPLPLKKNKYKKKINTKFMSDIKISRTTAVWLVKVCTRLMRDATNSTWSPVQSTLTVFNPGNFMDKFLFKTVEEPSLRPWVEALLSVTRILAASLAFQLDEEDLLTMHGEINADEITQLDNYFE